LAIGHGSCSCVSAANIRDFVFVKVGEAFLPLTSARASGSGMAGRLGGVRAPQRIAAFNKALKKGR
jgi:hypothetical protein